MDDATRHIEEQTMPQLRQMEGFQGFVALGDRQSGKVLGVAFWESEEALRATEQALSSVRSGAAEAAGGTLTSVERYEVLFNEAPSAGPVSGVTDTVGGVTDTVGGAAGNLLGGGEKKS
jgi:heme-degrading monooxygenase HmoA